jgi:Fur family ferric uptake transcriptional regulator
MAHPPPADRPVASERQTRQRSVIRDVIHEAGVPLAPKEILERAQSQVEGLGLATVYRTLKLLIEAGAVVSVEIPGDSPRFEATGKGHHHHFYCRGCARVFEVEGCPGDFASIAPAGFTLDGHELVLFGRCKDCGPAASKGCGYISCNSSGCAHTDGV